jgi:hypothetical protein
LTEQGERERARGPVVCVLGTYATVLFCPVLLGFACLQAANCTGRAQAQLSGTAAVVGRPRSLVR